MIYDLMLWGGAALSVGGLIGLGWCILRVMKAKRAKLEDEALRAVIQKVLPWNMGALMLSLLGLMLVGLGAALS